MALHFLEVAGVAITIVRILLVEVGERVGQKVDVLLVFGQLLVGFVQLLPETGNRALALHEELAVLTLLLGGSLLEVLEVVLVRTVDLQLLVLFLEASQKALLL